MELTKRFIPVLGVLSLATAACGTSSGTSGSGSSGGGTGNISSCSGAVTVASDLPTSGGDASIGGGTEKGVKLAVDQANQAKLLGGCTITYLAKDDASAAKGKHDPNQGAANMRDLVGNKAVVGVVGPFNSGVAVAELPISSAGGLVQISPSNTDPGLTIAGSDPDIDTASLHKGTKNTYFRVISNDIIQAQVMAKFAYTEQHLKNIYDIDDKETYGKDLSNYFDQFFKALGGQVTRTSIAGDTKDFKPAMNTAKGLSPAVDGVFFGGVASNGSGLIKLAMQQVGLNVPFLSGDGTVDPQYFKDAGDVGNGNAFASSAPDATKLPSAAKFNSDFKAATSGDPVAYSAYGYDCMNILLTAIKNVIVANGGQIPGDADAFRSSVIDQVAAAKYDGAIGHTEFDKNGDTLNKAFTIYQATGGTWVGKETVTAS